MFKQIDQQYYPTIKTFVNNLKYKVSANSVLDGNSKGEVFADDAINPTIVLIWLKPNVGLVFGKIESLVIFNKALTKLLYEVIEPECIKDGNVGFFLTFFNKEYWEEYADNVIDDYYLLRCDRWLGEFNQEYYQEFKSQFTKMLPEGYTLCRISKEIIECADNTALKDQILETWYDVDAYLAKGFGFCILKDSKVISSTFTAFVSDNINYEISIETFDEQERKKGFAAQCTIAYIDYCINNNYLPHWETDWDNIESHNLATKVAFPKSHYDINFQFRFNRADNYLVNTFCHIRDSKEIDLNFIDFCINKAFENESITPTKPNFMFSVAEKLAANNITEHVIFLLDKVLALDEKYLQVVTTFECFKPLHDTEEWAELLKNYQ